MYRHQQCRGILKTGGTKIYWRVVLGWKSTLWLLHQKVTKKHEMGGNKIKNVHKLFINSWALEKTTDSKVVPKIQKSTNPHGQTKKMSKNSKKTKSLIKKFNNTLGCNWRVLLLCSSGSELRAKDENLKEKNTHKIKTPKTLELYV